MFLFSQSLRSIYYYYDNEYNYLFLFFFFQAEDGIRDIGVTGVPDVCSSDLDGVLGQDVLVGQAEVDRDGVARHAAHVGGEGHLVGAVVVAVARGEEDGVAADGELGGVLPVRSEERRVGKECTTRCAPYHLKK